MKTLLSCLWLAFLFLAALDSDAQRVTSNSTPTLQPSLYLRNDPGTSNQSGQQFGYIFSNMANGIMFQAGTTGIDANTATGHMVIGANGNVGVGTTSPANILHLYENNSKVSADVGMTIEQDGSGDSKLQYLLTGVRRWVTGIDNADSDKFIIGQGTDWHQGKNFVIETSGNVGIGTSSPSEKLEVNGNIKATSPSTNVIYYRLLRAPESNLHLDAAIGNDIYLNHYQGNNVRFGPLGNWMIVKNDGNVGIGTTTPSEKLEVNGTIRTKEVVVESTGWPDYVFSDTYELSDLSEVSDYIDDNGHLPNIPSAKDVEENGIKLGQMNAKLLEKIEELTLYIIDLEARMQKLEKN